MNNFKKGLIAGAIALMSVGANAQIITHGYLTTDTDGDIIADTTNGREYMRFDTFDMTAADTIVATNSGGIYESWSIADSAINDDFLDAILNQYGTNACSVGADLSNGSEFCGTLTGWVDGSFGESHVSTQDYYAYFSDGPEDYGVSYFYSGNVREANSWNDTSQLDFHNAINGFPVNLLLYRDNASASVTNGLGAPASVPLPASLGLLGLAMAGFGFRRKASL